MINILICLKSMVRCDRVYFGYGMWKCFVFQGILGFGVGLDCGYFMGNRIEFLNL